MRPTKKILPLFALLLCTCAQNPDNSATVKLFLSEDSELASYRNLAADFGALSAGPDPASLSDIHCLGLFVGYPDGKDNLGFCEGSESLLPVASYGGLLKTGSTGSLSANGLKKGKSAELTLFGFRQPFPSQQCANLSPDFEPDALGYSDPFIVGRAELVLNPGPNNVSINSSFDASKFFDDCNGPLFGDDNNNTLSSNLISFWNFDDNVADAFKPGAETAFSWIGTPPVTYASGIAGTHGVSLTSTGYLQNGKDYYFLNAGNSKSYSGWYKFGSDSDFVFWAATLMNLNC